MRFVFCRSSWIAALAVLSALFAAPAVAAVTASGTWADGATVTLSGTGFGNRTFSRPIYFDLGNRVYIDSATPTTPYAALSDGSAIPVGGSNVWTNRNPSGTAISPVISKSATHARGVLNTVLAFTQNSTLVGPAVAQNAWSAHPSNPKNLYVALWMKHTGQLDIKLLRLDGWGGDWASLNPQGALYSPDQFLYVDGCERLYGAGPGGGPEGVWLLHEFWVSYSDQTIRYWRGDSGTNKATRPVVNTFSGCSPTQQYPGIINQPDRSIFFREIGFEPTAGYPGESVYLSSIYMDYEYPRRRVEITDTPTWDRSSTSINYREMQMVTSWTDTSITIQVNQGALPDFTGKYAHIITEYVGNPRYTHSLDYTTVQTYAISGGGGGDVTPPIIMSPLPSGEQPYGTTSVTLQVTTNEAATCRYNATDVAYDSMGSTFGSTGGTDHQQTGFSTSNGSSYNRYVRCIDSAGNASTASSLIAFSVAATNYVVLDNADAGATNSGEWFASTYYPGYYGSNYHYAPNTSGHWFQWTTALTAGTYAVYAWWPAAAGRPTDAAYEITHSGGTATVAANQTTNGSQWNLLGTYSFGTTGTVRLLSGTTGDEGAAADAVRFVATAGDTTAPSVPTSLDAYSTSTDSVTLAWNASTDDVAIYTYRVEFCDGYDCTDWAVLSTTSNTTYTHSGITPSATPTLYRYRVQAEDTSQNISAFTTPLDYNARPTIPAFPGAQGGGAVSVGGRGGSICRVTNLNDSGAGSLRACVEASGPRTVVFQVGGTIELTSPLTVENPYLTVAGQTAPGGGILLSGRLIASGDLVEVNASHVIWRFVKLRKGGQSVTTPGDSFVIRSGSGIPNIFGVILDHSSLSWADDENLAAGSFAGVRIDDLSFSWNIISEALLPASKGMLAGGDRNMKKIDIHHNMFLHNANRNPFTSIRDQSIINNVIYAWRGGDGTMIRGGVLVDIIGNVYKKGPSTDNDDIEWNSYCSTTMCNGSQYCFPDPPSIFIAGNSGHLANDPDDDNWSLLEGWGSVGCEGIYPSGNWPVPVSFRKSVPVAVTSPRAFPIAIHHVVDNGLASMLLSDAGASKRLDCDGSWVANRDAVDQRLVSQYEAGTGDIPTVPGDVGGFPTITAGTACTDTDSDGMPDVWETANGLNTNSAADANAVHASGYTNLEWYLAGPQSADAAAPTAHGLSPAGDLTAPVNTVALQVMTDEVAECRFGVSGTAFGSMTAFNTTNSTTHLHDFSVQHGGVYRRCYRCQDDADNISDEVCTKFAVPATRRRLILH